MHTSFREHQQIELYLAQYMLLKNSKDYFLTFRQMSFFVFENRGINIFIQGFIPTFEFVLQTTNSFLFNLQPT